MSHELLSGADRLISAALNGLYQGLIITAIVACCLHRGRSNAATRHATWLATLLVVALLIPAHCLRKNSFSESRDLANKGWLIGSNHPNDDAAGAVKPVLAFDALGQNVDPPSADLDGEVDEAVETEAAHGLAEANLSSYEQDANLAPPVEEPARWAYARRGLGRLMNPVSFNLGLGGGSGRYASVAVVILWLGLTGVCVAVLMQRLYRIRRLKRSSEMPSPALRALFEQVKADMGTGRRVNLRVSAAQLSPVVLGFFEPMVLLPADLPLNEGEQILRHELAHVCRRDDWVNLLQHFVGSFLFFHPAVWWIGRRLSLEREIACDDYVLRHSGRPRAYALLLADLAARVHGQAALLAPGASNNKSQLQQRIDMILNTHRNTSARLAKTRLWAITATAAVLASVALFAGPRVVLAQAALPSPSPSPARAGIPGGAGVVAFAPAALPVPEPSADVPAIAFDYKARPANPYVPAPPAAIPAPPTPVIPGPHPPAKMNSLAQNDPPRPTRAARAARADGTSLEERLDRLEKMVESLLAQQGPKIKSPEFHLKGPARPGAAAGLIDPKELEQMARQQAEYARGQVELSNKQLAEQHKQLARREAERAVEDLKRKESEHGPKQDAKRQIRGKAKFQQLEALKRQLQALEREKERLSHEIERLSQDQQKLQSDLDDEIDVDLSADEDKTPDGVRK